MPSRVNLPGEVVLDEAIVPRRGERRSTGKRVLLTGATGYLGAFLAEELLRSGCAVTCLARGRDDEDARARVLAAMRVHGLSTDGGEARLSVVAGDLSRPLLGLAASTFDRLAEEIDTVVHGGASVNFLMHYSVLKRANVGGTVEALRFACRGAPKRFHFVSTIGVFLSPYYAGRTITEAEAPAGAEALAPGYAQSKWVAENVVRLAMARGLEVTIHRPGFIGWHSRSGAFNRKDFVSGLLAASLSLRATPCLDLVIDVTSVDYVAQALVHLVRQSDSVNRTYHLNAEAPVSWRDVVAACREQGERWDEVPYPVWRDRMEAARGHMFELFATMLPEQNVEGDGSILDALSPRRFPRFLFEATRGALGAGGVSCPRMDAAAMAPVLTRIRGALANDEQRT